MEIGWYDALRGISKLSAKARRLMTSAPMRVLQGDFTLLGGDQFNKKIAFSQKISDEKATPALF